MRTKNAIRAACTAILLLIASLAIAQDSPGWAGKWKMVSTTANGDALDWMLTLKQDGAAWTATVGTQDGEAPAKGVKIDGASVHMKTPYKGDYYNIDLKLDGDKLTGKWSGNGDSGATNGTRVPAAAQ